MKRRVYLSTSLMVLQLLACVLGVTLVAMPVSAQPTAIHADETAATLAGLRPPKRARPVIAVIGTNSGTETTDYLVPFGVLKRADVAEVFAISTEQGPIKMMPALSIMPDATVAEFDARHPNGADYVIVPAIHHDSDAAALGWINAQAAKGAIIIGICSGAKVLGNAGLLDGRNATTHWYDVAELRKRHPTMRYVADRRFVVDRGVATTTGVSASIPMSLTLVEAIGGYEIAARVARDLGIEHWDARHVSAAFRSNRDFLLSIAGNTLSFWRHEKLALEVEAGVDEVALALTADAWSRTYRSGIAVYAEQGDMVRTLNGTNVLDGMVRTLNGINVLVDHNGPPKRSTLPKIDSAYPARALDTALAGIAERYGRRTWSLVALQLEYPMSAPDTDQR